LTKSNAITYGKVLGNDEYSRITGVDRNLVDKTLTDFPAPVFQYRSLSESERDEIILTVLKKLEETGLPSSGINDVSRWDKGWGEVLETVKNAKISINLLRPQYFHYNTLRFERNYIGVPDGSAEFDFYTTIRRILFRKYFSDFSKIVELGCGTGTNLAILSELFPEALLVGCDWASPSQEILKIMAKEFRAKIEGVRLNMLTLEGSENVKIDSETAVITMHAMEQLGTSFQSLLDYLLEKRPRLIFHIEPVFELYDSDRLFDVLAVKYHEKRNYLKGLLPALKALEANGKIEIMEVRRLFFGSLFHEGYSLIVWKII
jgi:SAM-dependent methyltransferase